MTTLREILDSPELFASKSLKVLDKSGNLVPLNWNPVQKLIYPKLTGRDLIVKARQMGVSTMMQGEIFRRLVTRTTRALSLSKNDEGTAYLREMNDIFYKYFPEPKPKRKYANSQVTTYPELNSSHFIGTAGSSEVGRGTSFNFIHGTEVAFWKDPEKILSGALQSGNPFVVLESTANGAQGWFYETCMDALAGRGIWNLIFIPYTEYPEYLTPGWVETKKAELPKTFAQEYPENVVEAFLVSNTGFFSDIQIDYTAPLNPERVQGHFYSMGVDWGMSGDYTVAVVLDRTANQMVDYSRFNKMSWELQRLKLMELYRKWRPEGCRIEANSIGSVNIEELFKMGMELEKFDTTNSSKQKIMNLLHEDLETGLKLQNIDVLRSEINTMTSKQTASGLWTISAEGNNHDDSVIALALANSAKRTLERQARSWR